MRTIEHRLKQYMWFSSHSNTNIREKTGLGSMAVIQVKKMNSELTPVFRIVHVIRSILENSL